MCVGANKAGELGYVESGSYGESEIDIYEWPRRRLWFEKVRTIHSINSIRLSPIKPPGCIVQSELFFLR
jgi:hypothetical protein